MPIIGVGIGHTKVSFLRGQHRGFAENHDAVIEWLRRAGDRECGRSGDSQRGPPKACLHRRRMRRGSRMGTRGNSAANCRLSSAAWAATKRALAPASAVGLPVTRQPPHRSRRAVFPHRALRRHSLPEADRARHGTAYCSGPASLTPTGRFALLSVPSCPVSVSFAGFVSTPAPSPCERLSRSLSTMSWSDSQVVFSSPSFGRLHLPAFAGTSWVSQVLRCFSSRMPRSFPTPADPRQPHPWRLLRFGFWKAQTIAACSFNINEAVSSFREVRSPLRPT